MKKASVTRDTSFTHAGVEVAYTTLTLPTYAKGPIDPNPPLFAWGVRSPYPYRWQKSFTERIEERQYDAVTLKTRWIEATILPDWGFHLYRAVDRVTGRDLFYCPRVMKPAHNAIRGAYIGGGVEMNYPIGHNVMTCARVALHLRATDEGVTALFHNVDRGSGMAYAAGITLSADIRGILFDQYLHNPTPLPRPWYYWLNAGLTPDPSLRFLFPTEMMLGHFEGPFLETATRYTYPIYNGIDYSRYLNTPEPLGLFSPGGTTGWFGCWYADWDFGVARWAPPWTAAGQKFWSWGNSEEGRLWGEIGADIDYSIPEMQSGRPETQMDRGIMPPFAVQMHREWWMPVSGTGEFCAASPFGALSITVEDGPRLRISPAQAVEGCRIIVDGKALPDVLELTPGVTAEMSLPKPPREVRVEGADGVLFCWTARPEPPAANVETLFDRPAPVNAMSAEELYLKGFRHERSNRPDLARRCYAKALALDPGCSRVHLRLGLLCLLEDNPSEARKEFALALARDRGNEEALYLHGLAALWKGDIAQARVDLCRAAATGQAFRVPALALLARERLAADDAEGAGLLLDDGLLADPVSPAFLFPQALLARQSGEASEHEWLCDQLEWRLGASPTARYERRFGEVEDETRRLPAGDETEDGARIAVALEYLACGRREEAETILRETTSATGAMEAAYLLAWLRGEPVRPSPATPFFAWGREIRAALQAAVKRNPRDDVAHFALGCLLARIGRLEQAVEHLAAASTLAPEDALYAATLGRACLEAGKLEGARTALERAVTLAPPNPDAWIHLDRACARAGTRDAAWLERFAAAPEAVLENEEARIALATLAADLGEYDRAAELLAGRIFHPYELTHDLRNLWARIHRARAVALARAGKTNEAMAAIREALAYPKHLRLGKPLRRFDAKTLYTAGRILEAAGDADGARNYFTEAAAEDQPDPTLAKPWAALAEIALGQREEGQARLRALAEETRLLLDAWFHPDLDEELQAIIDLCEKMLGGWTPALEELGK